LDDPRLRCATVTDQPLRLNSEPVPQDAMPLGSGDHAGRVAAAIDWLTGLCGDYAPLRKQFIAAYFRHSAERIETRRTDLVERLRPYDGLYAPEDFLWSALMPLPRGWVPAGDQMLPADIVFWDGSQPIAIEIAPRTTPRQSALEAADVLVLRIEPRTVDVGPSLTESFQHFWQGQSLPSSPFRRPIPLGVIAA